MSPASLESVDPWPLAIADTQILGGSRPAVAAVRRRDCGVWTPHPRAVCRRPPLPERACGGSPACGPALEGFPWGQMDGRLRLPVRWGTFAAAGRSHRPFQIVLHSGPPCGGLGSRGDDVRLSGRGPWSPQG